MTVTESVDVVVVGGGTAGLNAALQLARTGRSVVLLERRPQGASGARWCNGVLPWQFERAGLAPPLPDEVHGEGGAVHMVSPTRAHRFTIGRNPIVDADMRALVERLRSLAVDAGVDLRWGVTDVELQIAAGRPTSLTAMHGGAEISLAARLFVDAAGYQGALRTQVPELASICPPSGPQDLCSAQQLILEIDDADAARAYLVAEGAEPGDAVTQVGMAGGYSTINIRVSPSFDEVSVLTGSIPATGAPTGPDLLRSVRDAHPWMGKTVFGGGGLIPLRRTYDRFTAPGIALVGDAACQVMGGHGSGIGFGLIAGKVLAEAADRAADAGSAEALWDYQATFLREFGAILAGYDAVRRMSVKLGPEGVERLFETGVFSEALVLPGLDQRLGLLNARETTDAAKVLASNPKLAKIVVPALAAMTTARGLYRLYPAAPGKGFERWAASVQRMLPRQDT